MRIDIELDDSHARKLSDLLKRQSGDAATLIQRAIDLYYNQVAQQFDANVILRQTGFIGCMQAEADLSARYKEHLANLNEKYDHR